MVISPPIVKMISFAAVLMPRDHLPVQSAIRLIQWQYVEVIEMPSLLKSFSSNLF